MCVAVCVLDEEKLDGSIWDRFTWSHVWLRYHLFDLLDKSTNVAEFFVYIVHEQPSDNDHKQRGDNLFVELHALIAVTSCGFYSLHVERDYVSSIVHW